MKVLLVRHGTAEDAGFRDGRVISDEERELTRDGKNEFKQTALVLARVISRIDILAASPFVRANQTAQIVAVNYGAKPIEELKALVPNGSAFAVLSWLENQDPSSCICLVGHEPLMGVLSGWMVYGEERSPVQFSKGSICCIEFPGIPSPGSGVIRWMLTRKLSAALVR